MWRASDIDCNGRLNEAEYIAFRKGMSSYYKNQMGQPIIAENLMNERFALEYRYYNEMDREEGITGDQWGKMVKAVSAAVKKGIDAYERSKKGHPPI